MKLCQTMLVDCEKDWRQGKPDIMRKERRWMNSVVKEAAKSKIEMPWARGARRLAFIAKRETPATTNKSARA